MMLLNRGMVFMYDLGGDLCAKALLPLYGVKNALYVFTMSIGRVLLNQSFISVNLLALPFFASLKCLLLVPRDDAHSREKILKS